MLMTARMMVVILMTVLTPPTNITRAMMMTMTRIVVMMNEDIGNDCESTENEVVGQHVGVSCCLLIFECDM